MRVYSRAPSSINVSSNLHHSKLIAVKKGNGRLESIHSISRRERGREKETNQLAAQTEPPRVTVS